MMRTESREALHQAASLIEEALRTERSNNIDMPALTSLITAQQCLRVAERQMDVRHGQ